MPRRLIIVPALIVAAGLLGCASDSRVQHWTRMSAAERESAIGRITSGCRLPANRIEILDGNEARVKPDANDAYESVDCMLRGLKKLPGIQLGFVGNEAYSNEVR